MSNSVNKSVIVTGASSGIGHEIAIYLAKTGYTVLATVRKKADIKKLNELEIENLKPLFPFDLTISEHIYNIADLIKSKIKLNAIPPLFSIVNVAGGGQIAPIELMDIQKFRDELEKRIVGPVILLQELLPFLRLTEGRIIWIATPGLFPLPYLTDIHAADFAVNYIARTLDLELLPDNIRNILIRCGGIKTSSPERGLAQLKEMLNKRSSDRLTHYKDRLIKFIDNQREFDAKRTEPVEVAKLVAKVLVTKKPKKRYQIGHLSKMGAVLEKLPQSWVDNIMGKREYKTLKQLDNKK